MNTEDFEKRLARQPLRQVPGEWREEILSAARQVSLPEHATRNTQQLPASRSLLSTINYQLSTLLWPHPTAWAGLAAVWLVILVINLSVYLDADSVDADSAGHPTAATGEGQLQAL